MPKRAATLAALSLGLVVPGAVAASTTVACDPGVEPEYCDDSQWYDSGSADPSDPYADDPYADPYAGDPYGGDPYADPYAGDPYGGDPYADPYGGDPFADPYGSDPYADPADPADPGWTGTPMVERWVAAEEIQAVASRTDVSDDVDPQALPVGGAARVGASRLVLGIDALAELGVFGRHPSPSVGGLVRSIRTTVPSDGLDDVGYRAEIRRLADDLGPLVAHLRSLGVPVGQPLDDVLGTLSDPSFIEALEAGDTAFADPEPWLSATTDLLVRDGAEPSDAAQRSQELGLVLALARSLGSGEGGNPVGSTVTTAPERSTTSASIDRATIAEQDDAAASSDDTGSGVALPLVAGAILALMAGIVVVARSRRPPPTDRRRSPAGGPGPSAAGGDAAAEGRPTPGSASLEDLLDVSRRMTSSLDEAEVAAIALVEARRLVEAEGGLIAVRGDDGLRVLHHEPTSLFDLDRVADGGLPRVIDSGRPMIQIADDEPSLVEMPMAMAAIPIVADGVVAGVLMVLRVPARPFEREELDGLEMLAPLVGSALQAAETHESATMLADIDPLSGLNNRRRLTADLAERAGVSLATFMIDIDHFKNFNDTNGHAAGDEALRRVATLLAENVRPADVVYRYGGEEFCALLAETTPEEAGLVAERVRAAVAATDIPGGENQPGGRVTISVGVAGSEPGNHHDIIERADAALYEAKRGGRNRVHRAR